MTKENEEIVRVMRIIIYEGERSWVENTLARSLRDGTKFLNPNDISSKRKITVRTINEFPEIVVAHEHTTNIGQIDS